MNLREKYDALMYQINTPRITTMGPCERNCGGYARGSAICAACIAADIDKTLGYDWAENIVLEYHLVKVELWAL